MKSPGNAGSALTRAAQKTDAPGRLKKAAAVAPRGKANTTTASSSTTRSEDQAKSEHGRFSRERPAIIVKSPFNRKNFDPAKLAEMTENVRQHGVLEPLIVRPVKTGEWFVEACRLSGEDGFWVVSRGYLAWSSRSVPTEPHPGDAYWAKFVPPWFKTEREATYHLPQYEIVAGERRWRAATAAAVEDVPVIIRDLDDRQAIEFQIIENLQREDVQPLDQARSYRLLLDFGLSMDDVAKKVDLGKSTIYERLKLLELPDAAQVALESGKLPPSHAGLITKAKTPEVREHLVGLLLKPVDVYAGDGFKKDMIAFRDAERLVEEAVQEEKKEQAWQVQAKEFLEKGYKVLTRKQSASVFRYGSLAAGYVGVGDKCEYDEKGRTWKVVLGDKAPQAMAAIDNWSSKPRVVYPKKAATRAAKDLGLKIDVDPKVSREQAEARRREEQAREREEAYVSAAIDIGVVVKAAESREPNADFFRFIIEGLTDSRLEENLLRRRNIEVDKKHGHLAEEKAFRAFFEKADGKTLRGLLVEMFLWSWEEADEEMLAAAAKLFKVKLQASGKKKGKSGEEDVG